MSIELFSDFKGQVYTLDDVTNAMKNLGANKAKILYIHTDIGFGKPILKRKDFIAKLYASILALGVRTLIFPTYTFSFCNREIYDIKNSKTPMGMLNEYARCQNGAFRTKDPLMSVCVIGEVPSELKNISKFSCGKGSAFEIMAQSDENMFLFFGAKPTECFTFFHYIESIYGVPYRYDRDFSGEIIDENGIKSNDTYKLCTLYDTVIPYIDMKLQDRLEAKNILKKSPLGEKELMLIKGKSSVDEAMGWLKEDINVFLKRPYDLYPLGKSYSYGGVVSVK